MKRKSAIFVLAAVMVMGVVFGCGKTETAVPQSASVEENEPAVDEAIDEAADEAATDQENSFEDEAIQWEEGLSIDGMPVNDRLTLKEYMQSVTGITDRDIMLSDLQGIEELDFSESGLYGVSVEELSFLSRMQNLKVLKLDANTVSPSYDILEENPTLLELPASLEELSVSGETYAVDGIQICGLPKLSVLKMPVREADSLSDLPSLTELDLRYSGYLNDISALAEFTGLTKLNLSFCGEVNGGLEDISALSGMTELTELNLSGCARISNIDALSGMTEFTKLNLSGCEGISNIDALSGMTKLTELNLSGCEGISSIDALSGMTELTALDLSNCYGISNIDALSGMTKLTSLKIDTRRVTDISTLTKLASLKELELLVDIQNRPANLDILSSLTGVEALSITFNMGDFDAGILSGMSGLKDLTLHAINGHTENLSGLAALPNLTSLHLFNVDSRYDNLEELAALESLKELEVESNTHLELEFLMKLPNLTSLKLNYDIRGNETVLSGLTNLEELDLSEGQCYDISFLSGLTNLKKLNLGYCQNVDTNVLSNLPNLEELIVDGEQVTDVSALSDLKN